MIPQELLATLGTNKESLTHLLEMEEDGGRTFSSRASTDDLKPPETKLRLDSGVATSQESGLWSYAGTNKPVGIAQPFPKRESFDTDFVFDSVELKAELRSSDVGLKDSNNLGKSSLKGGGAESDSDTTSTFEFQFEPPSSGDDALKLPIGKRYHVFVTHSTSDQQWAEETTTSLSGKLKVKACYQCMPDPSCYDDRGIKDCMKQSCIILIGLSHNYLSSSRCCREWEAAVRLSHVNVVVASVAPCSRPDPLRKFLYLDFFDRDKTKHVWEMLIKTITETVEGMLSNHASPEGDRQPASSILQQQDNTVRTAILQQRSHSPPGIQHSHTSGSPPRDNRSELVVHGNEEETGHMMAGFEAMWVEGREGGDGLEGSGYSNSPCGREDGLKMGQEGIGGGKHAAWGTRNRDTEGSQDEVESEEECFKEAESPEEGNSGTRSIEERFGKGEDSSEEGTSGHGMITSDRGDSETKVHRDREEGEVSDDDVSQSDSQQALDSQVSKSSDVAVFYDNLARPDVDKRNESPIKLMRNFNNWVKSVLIRTYLKLCPNRNTIALDICCGKGGDLLKWKEGRISHLVCADISSESIAAAKDRYHSDKMTAGSRDRRPPFGADFYVADCTEERLSDMAETSRMFFHIASCQFSIHYSFESYRKAHMMLRNACESLRPRGLFIGTTIDADQLVHRLRTTGKCENGSVSIGNSLFTVTLDSALDIGNLPLFGARYNFKLHGVVDLPEYLIHFPLFEKMLEDFNMEIVLRQNFYDFFAEHRHKPEDNELLYRMEAFDKKTGTMSKEQWEIVGLYLVYVFRKKAPSHQ